MRARCVTAGHRCVRCHRRPLCLVALSIALALPPFGTSMAASAKARGCHKTHSCKSGGGGSSGTGGTTVPMTVQVDPNPLVETGASYVLSVTQVEASPSFAGDIVTVSSPQLSTTCGTFFFSLASPSGIITVPGSIQLTLDDEGNATTAMFGVSCAPGQDLIEADLDGAPYYTAVTTLSVEPPAVTTPGLFGYPTTSGTGTGGEVETGDSAFPASSDVYAIFDVETDPIYAEQIVDITSPQLVARCNGGASFAYANIFQTFGGINGAVLDNDGNAVFIFVGTACAAGSSLVTADVEAGTHPTYTTTFTVLPPQPTI